MTARSIGGRLLSITLVVVLAYFFSREHSSPQTHTFKASAAGNADRAVAAAMAAHQSNVAILGEGTVVKLLPDDQRGSRHQRFLLRLSSGATLLVAHNIDLAPRLDALRAGDSLRFAGEYVWNERGGVLHWTHHDPQGQHRDGWLELADRRYQ